MEPGVPFGILVLQKSDFGPELNQKRGLQVREHRVTKRLGAQNVAENNIGGVTKPHYAMSYGHFGRYEAILVNFSDFFEIFKKN